MNSAKEILEHSLQEKFGLTLEEWNELTEEEKTKLINRFHKRHPFYLGRKKLLFIGSGTESLIQWVKKGTEVWIPGYGFAKVGLSEAEQRESFQYDLDVEEYGRPVALVKKIIRKFKR